MATFARDLAVTARALTGTTEAGARRHGVGRYLPVLFADRFALMGGLDRDEVLAHLAACRTFEDAGWAAFWSTLAEEQIGRADAALARASAPSIEALLAAEPGEAAGVIDRVLGPAAAAWADSRGRRTDVDASDDADDADDATQGLEAVVRAITYLFAAGWPGLTPHRLAAYRRSRDLFELVLHGLADRLDVDVEVLLVDNPTPGVATGSDGRSAQVRATAVVPRSGRPLPGVLVTNGLEGTVQELLLPLIRHRDRGLAVVGVEMPGTYLHPGPLSPASLAAYTAVVDRLAADPRLDPDRLGVVGFSLGATWSTRLAAEEPRVRAAVSNGGFYDRSLRPGAAWGMPEIMLTTLAEVTGARHPIDLVRRLRRLATLDLAERIDVPLLVVNGADDSLADARDSRDLAEAAPLGELLLYPGDDHCAMGHYDDWLAHTVDWLAVRLDAQPPGRG